MEKEQVEDQLKQSNKGHRGTNDTLKKRWKQQKDKKKEKKEKKKNFDKEKQKENFFNQKEKKKEQDEYGIKLKKLRKKIKKFLKIYKDDLEDFYELFQNLDNGEEINLNEMENEKLKQILAKIFKVLKIKGVDGNYKKGLLNPIKKLGNYMKIKIDEAHEKDSDSESSSSEDEQIEQIQQKEKEKEIEKVEKVQQSEKRKGEELKEEKNKKVQLFGPQFDRQNVKGEELDKETKEKLEQYQQEIKDLYQIQEQKEKKQQQEGDWRTFLEEEFSKVGEGKKQNSLRNFLNSRKKEQPVVQKKQIDSSRYAKGSAKEGEDEMSKEEIEMFMKNYDQQFRQKTLMQIHQEKMALEKAEKKKAAPGERTHFDPKKDLSCITNRNYLVAIQKNNILGEKFSKGGFQSSFL